MEKILPALVLVAFIQIAHSIEPLPTLSKELTEFYRALQDSEYRNFFQAYPIPISDKDAVRTELFKLMDSQVSPAVAQYPVDEMDKNLKEIIHYHYSSKKVFDFASQLKGGNEKITQFASDLTAAGDESVGDWLSALNGAATVPVNQMATTLWMFELADSEEGASLMELSSVEKKFIGAVTAHSDVYKMLAAAGQRHQITFHPHDVEFLMSTTHQDKFYENLNLPNSLKDVLNKLTDLSLQVNIVKKFVAKRAVKSAEKAEKCAHFYSKVASKKSTHSPDDTIDIQNADIKTEWTALLAAIKAKDSSANLRPYADLILPFSESLSSKITSGDDISPAEWRPIEGQLAVALHDIAAADAEVLEFIAWVKDADNQRMFHDYLANIITPEQLKDKLGHLNMALWRAVEARPEQVENAKSDMLRTSEHLPTIFKIMFNTSGDAKLENLAYLVQYLTVQSWAGIKQFFAFRSFYELMPKPAPGDGSESLSGNNLGTSDKAMFDIFSGYYKGNPDEYITDPSITGLVIDCVENWDNTRCAVPTIIENKNGLIKSAKQKYRNLRFHQFLSYNLYGYFQRNQSALNALGFTVGNLNV